MAGQKTTMQNIIKRARAQTPPFFTSLRNISLAITAAATVLLTAPLVLPAAVTAAAGYLLTAGAVAGAVSQLTVTDEKAPNRKEAVKKGGGYDTGSQS